MDDILFMAKSSQKIYGSRFSLAQSQGTRLFNSQGKNFIKATDISAGVDDFKSIAPFNIYRVIVKYIAGKAQVVAREGDANFATYIANKDGDVFTMFPKYWYKRTQAANGDEIWLVSPKKIAGFWPSPLHYRNGVMHDWIGISSYQLGDDGNGGAQSMPGLPAKVNASWDGFHSLMAAKGLYVADYAATCHMQILGSIKYNNLNWQNVIGQGIANTYTGDGSTASEKATISETGTNRIIVVNATAAKFSVGDVVSLTTGTFFQSKITAIATYDTNNTAITIQWQRLFVPTTTTDNKYLDNTTGALATTGYNNNVSDYIPVSAAKYIITGHTFVQPSGNVGLAWYTSAKVFISGVNYGGSTGNGTYTRPSNAAYLRYTVNDIDISKSQVSAGFDVASGTTGIRRACNWTGETDTILGTDGMPVGTDGKTSVKTLGVENWYGNAWNIVGGAFRYNNTDFYVNTNIENINAWPATIDAAIAAGYVKIAGSVPANNGYIQTMNYDASLPWVTMTKTIGGTSNSPVGDYYATTAGNGFYIAFVGGNLGSSASAGPFYVNLGSGLSSAYWSFGAFGLFIPG